MKRIVGANLLLFFLQACGGALEPGQDLPAAEQNVVLHAADALPSGLSTDLWLLKSTHSNLCIQDLDFGLDNLKPMELAHCGMQATNRWTFTPLSNGNYVIRNFYSNKCLDILGASHNDGTLAVQSDCKPGAANQEFHLLEVAPQVYEVRAAHSNKCLDQNLDPARGGTKVVQQWTCHGGSNQRWKLSLAQLSQIAADASVGFCLVVDGASTSDGAAIYQWDCNLSRKDEHWYMNWYPSGYELRARHSAKCLDVTSVLDNGAKPLQWSCAETPQQRFSIVETSPYSYRYTLRPKTISKCLERDKKTNRRNGGTVQMWTCNSGDNQVWYLPGFAR